jgi:hypothetical protein
MDIKMNLTYNVEDIFEEIDGDPDNILMKIPQEILDHNGWKEGDVLTITVEDGTIVIIKNG